MLNLISEGVSSCGGGKYEDAKLSGIITVHGSISCNNFQSEGVCTLNGSLNADKVNISGTFKSSDSIKAESFNLYGIGKINGDLHGETLDVNGCIKVKDAINAENINILLAHKSSAKSCFGESINIKKEKSSNFLSTITKNIIFNVESIECDNIYIEYCNAESVCGKKIKIGPKCNIKHLEYSESYEADSTSVVSEVVKRGEN